MSEQQQQQRRGGSSDRTAPSFWANCGPFDGANATCGGGDDADSIVEGSAAAATGAAPPPLRPQQRVKNLVDGILSPFMACVQPNLQACMQPSAEATLWEPTHQSCYPMYRHTSSSTAATASSHHRRTASNSSSRRSTSTRPTPVVLTPHPHHQQPMSLMPNQSLGAPAIAAPNENDVLCGRGNNSVRHPGNQNFRDLIAANKAIYCTLTKKEKMLLARQIVDIILHTTDPPARFLSREQQLGSSTGGAGAVGWYDIGLPRSLEKTSQALREKSAAARAAAAAANNNTGAEIKSVLSSDNNSTTGALSDAGDDNSVAAAETTKSTQKTRKGSAVEAPPVTIPAHLQNVYGYKPHLQQAPPPPPPPPHHHHHAPYPPAPQMYQRAVFRSSPAAPHAAAAPEMTRSYSDHQYHRPTHPYEQQQGHHQHVHPHHHYYPPQQQQQLSPQHTPQYSNHASMLSPPRQSHHSSSTSYHHHPVVTPQPASHYHYHQQPPDRNSSNSNYERPPPLQSIVSSDSNTGAMFPVEEESAAANTHVRSTSDVTSADNNNNSGKISPPREQEWKRQRVSDKTKRCVAADNSHQGKEEQLNKSNESSGSSTGLTKAIEKQLTLEDRVIRSPSAMMQSSISGRRRSLEQQPSRQQQRQQQEQQSALDVSADSSMDGLTALSTAAFLRLDESY